MLQEFVREMKSLNRHCDRLVNEIGQSATQFAVRHFVGTVYYDGSNFMQSNRLLYSPSVMNLGLNCSNRLVSQELGKSTKGLFNFVPVTKTDISVSSSMENHRIELNNFIDILGESDNYYVRCFKPSSTVFHGRKVEHGFLLRQIKASCIVFTINLFKAGFSQEVDYDAFEAKFRCLVDRDSSNSLKDVLVNDRVQIMLSILFSSFIQRYGESEFTMPFACGKSKVFFREGALDFLECQRENFLSIAASKIQRWTKNKMESYQGKHFVTKLIKVQSIARRRKELRRNEITRKHISTHQRGSKDSLKLISSLIAIESAIPKVQAWYRALSLRKKFRQKVNVTTTLSRWWRKQPHRNLSFQKLWFAKMIPIYLKAIKHFKCYDTKKHQKFIRTIQNTDSFHHRVPYKLIYNRFICLMPESRHIKMLGMTEIEKVRFMMSVLFAPFIEECHIQDSLREHCPPPYQCGKTRCFFRAVSIECTF
jgi:myosin heavy subunit